MAILSLLARSVGDSRSLLPVLRLLAALRQSKLEKLLTWDFLAWKNVLTPANRLILHRCSCNKRTGDARL